MFLHLVVVVVRRGQWTVLTMTDRSRVNKRNRVRKGNRRQAKDKRERKGGKGWTRNPLQGNLEQVGIQPSIWFLRDKGTISSRENRVRLHREPLSLTSQGSCSFLSVSPSLCFSNPFFFFLHFIEKSVRVERRA